MNITMSCKYVILLGIKISAQLPSEYLIFFRDFDKMEDRDLGILRKNSTVYSRFTVQIRQIDMSKCLISISFWRLIFESGLFFTYPIFFLVQIHRLIKGPAVRTGIPGGDRGRFCVSCFLRKKETQNRLHPGREVCKLSGFVAIFNILDSIYNYTL